MLSEAQKDTMSEELDTYIKRKEELAQNHKKLMDEVKANDDIIANNIRENEELDKSNRLLHNQTVTIAQEHNKLNALISQHELSLKEYAREIAINNMIDDQPNFFEVMQKRLTRLQEDLSDAGNDFINFIEPEEAAWKLEELMKQQGFNNIELLKGKNQYDHNIRETCSKKVDGESITIEFSKRTIDAIDRWLMLPTTTRYWQVS